MSELTGRTMTALSAMPLTIKLTIKPPAMEPRDFLIRPMADCYVMQQPNGQSVWVLIGMDVHSCQMIYVPFDHIVDRRLVLLDPADVERLGPALALENVFAGPGNGQPPTPPQNHRYSDDDIIDPSWTPSDAPAPETAAPASATGGEEPTPPA